MSQETRKGGLGRGLAALIPSAPSSTPRLGDSAADIVLGGTRNARRDHEDRERREAEDTEREKVARAFQDAGAEAHEEAAPPEATDPAATDETAATDDTDDTADTGDTGDTAATDPADTGDTSDTTEAADAAEPEKSDREAAKSSPTPTARRSRANVPRDATGAKVPPIIAQAAAENDARRRTEKRDEDAVGGDADTAVPQTAAEIGASYREVPVGEISPNPQQPRQVFEEDSLNELVHSIREFGLMQPIVVRPKPGETGFELIMGERRWRAAGQAGLETIPAIVRETDDGSMLRDALLENIHRVQLNPLEEASAYQQLLEEFDVTQAELADRLGRSRPVITNMIRLLALPVTVQRKVAAGVLSAGHARALLGVKGGEESQETLASRIIAEGLSVRATEEAVTLLNRGDEPEQPKQRTKTPPPEYLTQAAERLSDDLDTKVSVSMGKRKGKLVVEFGDREDFERIMSLIDREGA